MLERMEALKKLDKSWSLARPFLVLTGIAAIIGLMVLLYYVRTRSSRNRERKAINEFGAIADKYNLTSGEQRLVLTIARLSDISDISLIFSTPAAFYRGATKLMQERFAAGDSIQDRRQMKEVVEVVYQKLGLASATGTPSANAITLTSRQIPPGRRVSITAGHSTSGQLEATVSANNEDGLVLEFWDMNNVPATVGDRWRVRYSFGTSIWEFESDVTGVSEGMVRLAHCDLVRFTNRRRFLRVPVKGVAMVAHCEFEAQDTDVSAALPKFVSAQVFEIAGPGLRIVTSLQTTIGDRLLVVIGFENGQIIRDIAEVRHVQPSQHGFAVAVELVTLSDAEVSTLVRLTNVAAKGTESGKRPNHEVEPVAAGKA